MNALLQDALVALVVLAAAGFLVWRRVRRRARPGAFCGECPGCATGPRAPQDPPLLGISEPGPRPR